MKKALFILPALIALVIFFAGRETMDAVIVDEDVAMCSSPAGIGAAGPDGKFMTALDGWGNLKYKISTKVALASFREATRFDPSCAMTYWGQALAMGPFYNVYAYRMPKDVPGVVETMVRYSSTATEKEKGLIDALQKRYSKDLTNSDRKQLDRNYTTALASLGKKFSDDNNIKALYVDAVMLEHKWDFWQHNGTPRAWTPGLINICESVLEKEKHPAIMHYYIHVTEASREPSRALMAADMLKDQLPGVGHMVHMSSHMYQRNGLYSKGVKVNEDAHKANNNLDSKAPSLKLGKDKSIHYYAVQSYCAMTAGLYQKGLPIYDRARNRQVAMDPDFKKEMYPQFVYMMPVMARVRLGKWKEILQQPKPDESWTYAVALDNFSKGVAHVRNKDLTAAKKCLDNLNAAMKDPLMSVRYMPFNSPLQSCKVASGILSGEILYAEGKTAEAIAAFELAVEEEDALVYREPQDWLVPARQYLGAYLLKMDNAAEAEKVYREDLVLSPGNGWSLLGLHQALKSLGEAEAAEYETKYRKAFAESDVVATASVF
ncbi:MAG TPA: hypothetical protein VK508_03530 [Cyclobacteriaceae bacterium]|nr:hypothetical protein [Cyclobacteriaceae bacterium]